MDVDDDKKDKKMVTTWNVVVREKEGKVNLYCPTSSQNNDFYSIK